MLPDYYKILGVPFGADRDTIKRAFRKLAKKYHPDRNPSPVARQRFNRINEAYQVLADPQQRRQYHLRMALQYYVLRRQEEEKDPVERMREEYLAKVQEKKKKRPAPLTSEQQAMLFRYALKVFFLPLFGVTALLLSFYFYYSYQPVPSLSKNARFTTGSVYIVTSGYAYPVRLNYIYNVEGTYYSGHKKIQFRGSTMPLHDNGMPLRSGDEFVVIYDAANPFNSRLLLEYPTNAQLDKYRRMAMEQCVEQFEARNERLSAVMQYCDCLIRDMKQQRGVRFLASIYHQQTLPERNTLHNRNTYKEFRSDSLIQSIFEQCRKAYLGDGVEY